MDRQKQVLTAFNGDFDITLSKQEIITLAKIGYYHNTDKHAGDVLSRMVNNGTLERPKRGHFKLRSQRLTR